jgi:hypothetical protein
LRSSRFAAATSDNQTESACGADASGCAANGNLKALHEKRENVSAVTSPREGAPAGKGSLMETDGFAAKRPVGHLNSILKNTAGSPYTFAHTINRLTEEEIFPLDNGNPWEYK